MAMIGSPPLTPEQQAQLAAVPGLLASINALTAQLAGKADTSALTGLATTTALSAVDAKVPTAATSMPPGVADSGALGTQPTQFALSDHTHASKARKQIRVSSAATLTWVYPTPFAAGVVPICNGIAQVAAGNNDLFNVQILGVPTNTQCVFQINRVSGGLLALLLGALSINPTPATINLHLLALEP